MRLVSNTKELIAQLTDTFSTPASHCPFPVCLARDEEIPSNSAPSSPSTAVPAEKILSEKSRSLRVFLTTDAGNPVGVVEAGRQKKIAKMGFSRDNFSAGTAAPSMTWTDRGHYHLNRGENDLAVDCFTKALQEAEKQNDRELMSDCLKNLGQAFLEKEQGVLAAKIFNTAWALLCGSLNPKSRQTLLALMAEVERRYLEMDERIYCKDRLEVAIRLNNLGCAWKELGDKKAIVYFEQASRFLQKLRRGSSSCKNH